MQIAIDTAYFHHVCIFVLYGAVVVAAFIVFERAVYYGLLNSRASALNGVMKGAISGTAAERRLARRDIFSRNIANYLKAARDPHYTRAHLEDLSAAFYIHASDAVGGRLWLLDTIVTAAPLVGLLGTILGIMDTFNALSAGGISDPAAVSRGIGAALLATAIGIGTALFGLLGHNFLHRWSDHLTEEFKRLLLLGDIFVARHPVPRETAKLTTMAAE